MNLGMPEMIFIFLLALIIFGPRKLPEIGRQLGRAMTDFKRASNDFKAQLEDEIRQIETLEQSKTIESAEVSPYGESIHTIAPPAESVPYEAPHTGSLHAELSENPNAPRDTMTAAQG